MHADPTTSEAVSDEIPSDADPAVLDLYARTARHWLEKLDMQRDEIDALFVDTYGQADSTVWRQRWRIFFMSCEELFGYDSGQEWWVSHYCMAKRS